MATLTHVSRHRSVVEVRSYTVRCNGRQGKGLEMVPVDLLSPTGAVQLGNRGELRYESGSPRKAVSAQELGHTPRDYIHSEDTACKLAAEVWGSETCKENG